MASQKKKWENIFECSRCKFKSFETFDELVNHSIQCDHIFFTCLSCSILFSSHTIFMKHNTKWHSGPDTFFIPMPHDEKRRLLLNRKIEFKRRQTPRYKEYQKKYRQIIKNACGKQSKRT